MGRDLQHAPSQVSVPVGFTGHWCARCEQPAPGIPEEAGMPAKCPHCKKWTVVWVPPAEPVLGEPVTRENCRKYVTQERAREWFEEIKAIVDAEPGAEEGHR